MVKNLKKLLNSLGEDIKNKETVNLLTNIPKF